MTEPTAPSSIDWVDLSGVPAFSGKGGAGGDDMGSDGTAATGRLGMCGLAEAVSLTPADDIDVLVTLLDSAATFEELAPRTRVVRYPIVDMGVPADRESFAALVGSLVAEVRAGRTVVVSCLAGYGRTGLTVACLLVEAGSSAGEAIDLVRATRPGTIESDEQVAFVRGWRPD